MINRFIKQLTLLILMSIPVMAYAKDLYVDAATGNDSVSYAANSAATPWATLRRAVFGGDSWNLQDQSEAAQAGDTVFVQAGIYTVPGNGSRSVPSFMSVNSGDIVNGYITFQAVGRVELRLSSGNGSVIGAGQGGIYRNDYIKWDGFYINEAFAPHAPDTGPITIFSSHHVIIENCIVEGVTSTYRDNHNGIRVENSNNVVLRNNLIRGIHDRGTPPNDSDDAMWHHNSAGIMLYGSHDVLIEHNEITDAGSGIFPKGNDNYNITIRKNLIYGVRKGVRVSYSNTIGQNYIVQNVIRDGVWIDNLGINLAENTRNYIVANNTIDNVENGMYVTSSLNQENLVIQNNIITNTYTAFNAWVSTTKEYITDYNNYFVTTQWANAGTIYNTLAAWQTGINDDLNAITTDPQYMNRPSDYRLIPGSPALTLGVDIMDLDGDGDTNDTIAAGAFVVGNEVIGRSGDTIAPNPPVLISVQ